MLICRINVWLDPASHVTHVHQPKSEIFIIQLYSEPIYCLLSSFNLRFHLFYIRAAPRTTEPIISHQLDQTNLHRSIHSTPPKTRPVRKQAIKCTFQHRIPYPETSNIPFPALRAGTAHAHRRSGQYILPPSSITILTTTRTMHPTTHPIGQSEANTTTQATSSAYAFRNIISLPFPCRNSPPPAPRSIPDPRMCVPLTATLLVVMHPSGMMSCITRDRHVDGEERTGAMALRTGSTGRSHIP